MRFLSELFFFFFFFLLIWEFFTPVLVGGFPLEFEGQHVSSSPQDSS